MSDRITQRWTTRPIVSAGDTMPPPTVAAGDTEQPSYIFKNNTAPAVERLWTTSHLNRPPQAGAEKNPQRASPSTQGLTQQPV